MGNLWRPLTKCFFRVTDAIHITSAVDDVPPYDPSLVIPSLEKIFPSNPDIVPVLASFQQANENPSTIRTKDGRVTTIPEDYILLRLNRSVSGSGAVSIPLSLLNKQDVATTVYAVGTVDAFHFSTGEKMSVGGKAPPLAGKKLGSLLFPSFLEPSGNAVRTERAGVAQTLYSLNPDSGSAFSIFLKSDPTNDQSFRPEMNPLFHPTLTQEELGLCGPIVEGMSGGGIFRLKNGKWTLIGVTSNTRDALCRIGNLEYPVAFNVYRIFTQSHIDKINFYLNTSSSRTPEGAAASANNPFQVIHYTEGEI